MVSVPVVLAYSCSLPHQSSSINIYLVSLSSPLINFFNCRPEGMETSKEEGKRMMQGHELDEEGDEDEDIGEDNKKKGGELTPSKKRVSGAGGSTQCSCQAEGCTANMADAKPYHRRHKVCEFHAKASVVLLSGSRKRFCQQCSRFHELPEFDEAKRSCRRRLAGHNERRRKSSYDSQ